MKSFTVGDLWTAMQHVKTNGFYCLCESCQKVYALTLNEALQDKEIAILPPQCWDTRCSIIEEFENSILPELVEGR